MSEDDQVLKTFGVLLFNLFCLINRKLFKQTSFIWRVSGRPLQKSLIFLKQMRRLFAWEQLPPFMFNIGSERTRLLLNP